MSLVLQSQPRPSSFQLLTVGGLDDGAQFAFAARARGKKRALDDDAVDVGADADAHTPFPVATTEEGPLRARPRLADDDEDQGVRDNCTQLNTNGNSNAECDEASTPSPCPLPSTSVGVCTASPAQQQQQQQQQPGCTTVITPQSVPTVKPTPEVRAATLRQLKTIFASLVVPSPDAATRLQRLAEHVEANAFACCASLATYSSILQTKVDRLHQLRLQRASTTTNSTPTSTTTTTPTTTQLNIPAPTQTSGQDTGVINHQQTDADADTAAPMEDVTTAATTATAPTPSQRVFWEWQHPRGHWVRYLHSNQIESYAQQNCAVLRYALGRHVYQLDLGKRVQRNTTTGTIRPIRRVETFTASQGPKQDQGEGDEDREGSESGCGSHFQPTDLAPPAHWGNKGFTGVLRELAADTPEYARVAAMFAESRLPTKQIKRIRRVEAPLLWANYRMKCAGIAALNGGDPREAFLFHGTSAAAIDPICQQGFNRAFSGQHGAALGFGVYFALDSGYSCQDKFAPVDQKGDCHVILARVAVGQYTKGEKTLRAPPAIPHAPNPHVLYDSVVDREENPAIFAVFHDTQAYPEYVITC